MRTRASILVMLLAACAGPTAPTGDLELRTSRSAYAPWEPVIVEAVNAGHQPVYVAHCDGRLSLMLQRRVGGAWADHRQVNAALCHGAHPMGDTAVVRGASITESVTIEETGDFRFTLHARRAHEDFGSLLVATPRFSIRYPPD